VARGWRRPGSLQLGFRVADAGAQQFLSERLDGLPDARDRGLAVRELLDRLEVAEGRRAGEGVPDFDEPRDGPVGGELSQFLLGCERDHVVLRGRRRVVGSDVAVGV
jgi:hypothetical protein